MGQRLGSMFGASGLALVAAFAVGCGYEGDSALDGDGAVGGASAELRKGTPGAVNGQGDYCDDPLNKCVSGEGDCDVDYQCTGAGIVCGRLNGTRFGVWYSMDICWPSTCQNGLLDTGEVEIDNGGPCGCWLRTYYQDADYDGYGRPTTRSYCNGTAPANWSLVPGDCQDTIASINPGAAEICGDSIDQDCDAVVDDGCTVNTWCLDSDYDTYPIATGCLTQIAKPDSRNWITTNGATVYDCADNYASAHPGATEICNGVDDNCNGTVDDGVIPTWYNDGDGDGSPRNQSIVSCYQPSGSWLAGPFTVFDCNDANATIYPTAAETCNGIDDNCNSVVDEGVMITWYLDSDGDGSPQDTTVLACTAPGANYLAGPFTVFDCDDTNAAMTPGGVEVCGDALDNDCNGTVDDACLAVNCYNTTQDANETGVDCGGFCDVCSVGAAPTSCVALPATCGAAGNVDCCAGGTVFGADYIRSYDAVGLTDTSATATVFSYVLDNYEVTVARYKQFLAAYDAWRAAGNPAVGAGAHPIAASTGWDTTWTASLPVDSATMITALTACTSYAGTTYSASTANDNLPITCPTWFEAFAFCVWDGGRLPTEPEWNLASAGGTEQRVYPWSSPATSSTITTNEAAYGFLLDGDSGTMTLGDLTTAGGLPAGKGRWSHYELGGNAWEWTFDTYSSTQPLPCVNCANTVTNPAKWRAIRGGAYSSTTTANIRSGARSFFVEGSRSANIGFRCARGG